MSLSSHHVYFSSVFSIPGSQIVWGASSPSICCHFWEMSGKSNALYRHWRGEAVCVFMSDLTFLCVCVRSAQMGSDSIIGAMCQVADKTSIKRSTIGNSTTVKEKVKVTNSIIMHGVTIEEGWEHTHLNTLMHTLVDDLAWKRISPSRHVYKLRF